MQLSERKSQWRDTGLENRRGHTQAGSIPVLSANLGPVAQSAEAPVSKAGQCWFESSRAHQFTRTISPRWQRQQS